MFRWLHRLVIRARATVSPGRDRELHAELQAHLRLLEEEYLAQGVPPDLARQRARVEFGNPATIQEASHDLFAFRPLEDFGRDVAYALRETRRNAAFTCVAVVSLAVGLAAATASFTIVDGAMLRTLPVRLPQRLVGFTLDGHGGDWAPWPYAAFVRWQRAPDRLVDVAASSDTVEIDTRTTPTPPLSTRVGLVSADYFQVLGADVALGRGIDASDAEERRAVAVVSDAFWRQRFGGTADALRSSIEIRGVHFEVIGVARRGFTGHQQGYPVDVWLPLTHQTTVRPGTHTLLDESPGAGARWLTIIGRLREGASLGQAAAQADVIRQSYLADKAAIVGADTPEVTRDRRDRLAIVPASRGNTPLRHRLSRPLGILSGITALVLLVAYANFTNLMFARAEARRRESTIRFALGANRWRLIRQAAAECVVLSGAAGLGALLLAAWANHASRALVTSVFSADLDLALDARRILFACACVAIAIVCGLWPSVRLMRSAEAIGVQRGGGSPSHGASPPSARRVLVVAQLALCVVLLIGAGLLLRTVLNLRWQDLGLDRSALLVPVSMARAGVDQESAAGAMRAMKARLESIPGVQAVGVSGSALLDPATYWVDGSQRLTTDRGVVLAGARWTFASVGEGFFAAAGMSLVKGREFGSVDVSGAAHVLVLNQALASFVFGSQDPVGRRIALSSRGPMHTVVGVVRDARQVSPRDRGIGVAYLPLRGFSEATFAVRPRTRPAGDAAFIAREAESIAGGALTGRARSVSQVLDRAIVEERVMSTISLTLALLVVAVGCVGVYALMAYDVSRRTHEIGVRFALGATRAQVMRIVFRDAVAIVAAALAIGVPLGVAANGLLASQLYDVGRADPWTLSVVGLLLALVTLAAALRPARAAAGIDPIVLLRHE
jgi:predicted permease